MTPSWPAVGTPANSDWRSPPPSYTSASTPTMNAASATSARSRRRSPRSPELHPAAASVLDGGQSFVDVLHEFLETVAEISSRRIHGARIALECRHTDDAHGGDLFHCCARATGVHRR